MADTITRYRKLNFGSRRGAVALIEASAANDETPPLVGYNVWHAQYATVDGNENDIGVNRNTDQALGDSPVSPAPAKQRLTLTGQPLAAETVTIGTTVYTFVAAPATAYDVDIGADASGSLDNLVAAINLSGTAGTEYGAGTAVHPTVSAVRGPSASLELIITAKTAGSAGNSIATTETLTNGSWKAVTMQGGADAQWLGAVLHVGIPTGTAMLSVMGK